MKQNMSSTQKKIIECFPVQPTDWKNRLPAYDLCVIQLLFPMQNKRITEK